MTANIVIGLIIVVCVAAAVRYIRNEKKRGVTCIGCPHGAECAKRNQGGCGTDRS